MTSNDMRTATEVGMTPWEQVLAHKDKLWYLACAYTGKTKLEVEENIHESMMIAGLLMKEGLHIHHPTYMTHKIAGMFDLPTNYEWWIKYNEHYIDAGHGVLVCRRNMKTSRGVKYEVQYAQRQWKPSFVVDRMGENLVVQEMYDAWPELS